LKIALHIGLINLNGTINVRQKLGLLYQKSRLFEDLRVKEISTAVTTHQSPTNTYLWSKELTGGDLCVNGGMILKLIL
jgi:ABC-type transporter Mla maintaining outer membrane lipid asymmetry ATPase subunit MlaF